MSGGRDRGFTLIELLVALSILTVVGAAVTQGLLIGLRTTDDTTDRLGASADAQILASYFVTDVQSATDVSTTDASCGGPPVVRLKWVDPGLPAPGVQLVSYTWLRAGAPLVRRVCVNGGAPSSQNVVSAASSVSCGPPCSGAVVSLSVTARGFSYTVEGRRRST